MAAVALVRSNASMEEINMIYYGQTQTPVGKLLIVSDGTHVTRISMDEQKYAPDIGKDWVMNEEIPPIKLAIEQFKSYFAGLLEHFDLPIAFHGTAFQERVWKELTKIPFGQTISYGELAKRIGKPKASRAVGLANGKNPIAIVVPCHRVIGANGTLTGYGGGLPRKKRLLELEQEFSK